MLGDNVWLVAPVRPKALCRPVKFFNMESDGPKYYSFLNPYIL